MIRDHRISRSIREEHDMVNSYYALAIANDRVKTAVKSAVVAAASRVVTLR
jgi:hypothetical protein